jgi:hypothetical protein
MLDFDQHQALISAHRENIELIKLSYDYTTQTPVYGLGQQEYIPPNVATRDNEGRRLYKIKNKLSF